MDSPHPHLWPRATTSIIEGNGGSVAMARTAKQDRTLPALPDSAGAFAEDGTLTPELAGWVRAMMQLAAKGDERASQALIEACRTMPGLWGYLSTLSSAAMRSWVDLLAPAGPGREIVRRTTEQEIERKRSQVAGKDPSPLERLLAERVALCWVAATYADAEYTRKLKAGMSFREGEYFSKRCEQTNRQLLRAIESLARVRRLLTPMQINIGQNQINLTQ